MSQGQPDTTPVTPAAVTAFAARRRRQLVLALVVALVVGLLPFAISDVYTMNILVLTVLFASLSQSWNILGGYCGQISLGHAAFMAVGGYSAAILGRELGMSFWLALPCAAIITGVVGLIFGLPSLRIKGLYLAVTTLAAQF
ncbi:MAG: branched-chain amino acid ABC transporter permease, partial [Roseovarius sp.]|nr:branched-chain amino acid ABC transporter permease [Roseovarius sp.]